MNKLASCLVLVLICAPGLPLHAEEPVSLAVMEFTGKGGITQDQMDALLDMAVTEIRTLGNFKIIDKGTINSIIRLEEQKQKLQSCNDQNCIAEFGNALGARYVVVGSVSLFGTAYLLNLKIIDAQKVEVLGGISKTIEGGVEQLLSILPLAVGELFTEAAPRLGATLRPTGPDESQWFSNTGNRKHRWTFSFQLGSVFIRPSRFRGNAKDADYLYNIPKEKILDTDGIDAGNARNGAALRLGAGVGLLKWLEASILLGGYFAGDANGDWTHRGLELGAEVQAFVPLESWWEPLFFVSLGYSRKLDIAQMEHRVGRDGILSTPVLLDHSLTADGLLVDTGIGVNLFFMPRWFVGIRAGWSLRVYNNNMKHRINAPSDTLIDLELTKEKSLDATEISHAVALSLQTGFRL